MLRLVALILLIINSTIYAEVVSISKNSSSGGLIFPLEDKEISLRTINIVAVKNNVDIVYRIRNIGEAKDSIFILAPKINQGSEPPHQTEYIKYINDFCISINNIAANYEIVDKDAENKKYHDYFDDSIASSIYKMTISIPKGESEIRTRYSLDPLLVNEGRDYTFSIHLSDIKHWKKESSYFSSIQYYPSYPVPFLITPKIFKINGFGSDFNDKIDWGQKIILHTGFVESTGDLPTKLTISQPNLSAKNIGYWYKSWNKNDYELINTDKLLDEYFNLRYEYGILKSIARFNEIFSRLSIEDRRILRNIPFALKGYDFKKKELSTLFSKYSWYLAIGWINEKNIALDDIDREIIGRIIIFDRNN